MTVDYNVIFLPSVVFLVPKKSKIGDNNVKLMTIKKARVVRGHTICKPCTDLEKVVIIRTKEDLL